MSLEKIEHEKHRMVTYLAKHPELATNPIFIKEALDNFERIICKEVCEEWNVDIEDAQALRKELTRIRGK